MTLTPEQENLKKAWLAQREIHSLRVGSYAEWAAEEALNDALGNCIEAGFDPRNPCSEVYLPVSEKPCSLTPPDPEPPSKPVTKYNLTVRTVIITPEDDTCSPIFSERAVIVTVEDEAGGPFILLSTPDRDSCRGEVRLDPEELKVVLEVARELIGQETLKEKGSVTRP